MLYKIRWEGFGKDDDTFESVNSLENCSEMLIEYQRANNLLVE
jgi:hypothetical protein